MKDYRYRAALCIMLAGGSAVGEIIRVPADSPTIQIAIEKARPFDTIIVSPGTYSEAINFLDKVIVVQSTNPNDPAVVAATVINAAGLGTVVTFSGSEDQENTLLTGFTITGGTYGIDGHGSLAAVRDSVIRDNSSIGVYDVDGSLFRCAVIRNGAGLNGCDGTVSQCVIDKNSGYGVSGCHGTIRDCRIIKCGGGIYDSRAHILRCIISGNENHGMLICNGHIQQCVISANGGSGLRQCNFGFVENSVIVGNRESGFTYCSSGVLNCTITGNSRYGIEGGGPIIHSIIWSNLLGPLTDSAPPLLSGTANPFFVRPGYRDFATNTWVDGDYHLSPDSPYIDAGSPSYGTDPNDPNEDLDGNPRVAGRRIDLGAFEFQAACIGPDFDADETPDVCDRDIDGDGVPNVVDRCDDTPAGVPVNDVGRPLADLNHDCAVNLADFAVFQNSLVAP